LSYSEALEECSLVRLDTRREEITQCTFRQVSYSSTALHVTTPQGFHFSDDITTDLPFFQLQSVKNKIWSRFNSVLDNFIHHQMVESGKINEKP